VREDEKVKSLDLKNLKSPKRGRGYFHFFAPKRPSMKIRQNEDRENNPSQKNKPKEIIGHYYIHSLL